MPFLLNVLFSTHQCVSFFAWKVRFAAEPGGRFDDNPAVLRRADGAGCCDAPGSVWYPG